MGATENVVIRRLLLEVIRIGASLVFTVWPLLSRSTCVPFSLPHEGNPERDAFMAKIQAVVAKGAVITLPQDPGLGFYCNFFLMTKVMGQGVPAGNQP